MLMRRCWVALGAVAMALGAGCASAQMTADYPPNYPFGANGTPAHPDGYDGYPGDHPNATNGHGGPGGNGWGSGNGGKGGDGVNGGNGGSGGNSGPNGGVGGNGGDGGDTASGHGGDGGNGGDGVEGGGDGGNGGEGTTGGGDGGNGGDAQAEGADGGDGGHGGDGLDDGQGGDGGNGGDATDEDGHGGFGGNGGDAESGVGGNGGDGGDAPINPGPRGEAGTGAAGTGQPGHRGRRTNFVFGAAVPLQREPLFDVRIVAQAGQMTPHEYAESLQWEDLPGTEIDWGEISVTWYFQDPDDILTIVGGLHPDSLELERIRVIVEYRETGETPVLDVTFGGGTTVASNKPIIGDPGWKGAVFTVVRPDGGPLGAFLDEFTYRTRDVEVRRFEIVDLGPIGDLNLDGQSDGADLAVVGVNFGAAGVLPVEEGDANADGAVNTTDAQIVVEDAAGG